MTYQHASDRGPVRLLTGTFLTLSLLLMVPTSGHSGGLYIVEFMTPSMGTAGAGREAYAHDASTASATHNPAGMTRMKGSEISVGAGFLAGNTVFDQSAGTPFDGDDGGNQAGFAPVMGTAGVKKVSDDLSFGLSFLSWSGATLDPRDSWTGRYHLMDIELLTVAANPAVAYKINDHFSIGAGATILYTDISYTLGAPAIGAPVGGAGKVKLDGDDISFGYNLGALVEFNDQTRVGITYMSKHEVELDGDLKVRGGGGGGLTASANTDFTFPQTVRIGGYHELNSQWALLGSVAWEDWSNFDAFAVSTNLGGAAIPTNWEDTYHFGLGVHYRPDEQWLLQTGIAYDSSPVSSSDREAWLPIDRQIRLAAGAQYQVSEKLSVGGALEYVDLGDAKINSSTLAGDYDKNYMIAVGVNMNYKF